MLDAGHLACLHRHADRINVNSAYLADAEPPAALQAPESVDAQVPSQAKAADAGGTGKTSDASETGDPRRVVTKGRTKEQAERDAIETRRLIARDLADSPPANSDDRKPPPGP